MLAAKLLRNNRQRFFHRVHMKLIDEMNLREALVQVRAQGRSIVFHLRVAVAEGKSTDASSASEVIPRPSAFCLAYGKIRASSSQTGTSDD